MLSARDIRLSRGGRSILSGIDIDIVPGTVTAILGPNGAGKSSLPRVPPGEWQPETGKVHLGKRRLSEVPIRRLGQLRAYLHQESSLSFAFTVLEVVLLGRSPHMEGSERPQDYAIAREALKEVDLADRERDYYTTLSGGGKATGAPGPGASPDRRDGGGNAVPPAR